MLLLLIKPPQRNNIQCSHVEAVLAFLAYARINLLNASLQFVISVIIVPFRELSFPGIFLGQSAMHTHSQNTQKPYCTVYTLQPHSRKTPNIKAAALPNMKMCLMQCIRIEMKR